MRADDNRNAARPGTVRGVVILDKPSGMTSRALVDRVARRFARVKVGHAGTLDPLASGILIVCIGTATRLVEELQELPKSYRTVVRLGARSDTLDALGRIVEDSCLRIPAREEVAEAVPQFVGHVLQQPPDYSALKIRGRRAYDLARAGQAVELA